MELFNELKVTPTQELKILGKRGVERVLQLTVKQAEELIAALKAKVLERGVEAMAGGEAAKPNPLEPKWIPSPPQST
jgi:hypothetical protein